MENISSLVAIASVQSVWMMGEKLSDELPHFLFDGILWKRRGIGPGRAAVPRQPIFSIKAVLSSDRFFALHKDTGRPAHKTIKSVHFPWRTSRITVFELLRG